MHDRSIEYSSSVVTVETVWKFQKRFLQEIVGLQNPGKKTDIKDSEKDQSMN